MTEEAYDWTPDLYRISDLIAQLNKFLERHGDLPVYTYSEKARCYQPLGDGQVSTGEVRYRRRSMKALLIWAPEDRGFRPDSD